MRLILALFLLLPTPLWASCERNFRGGLAAFDAAARTLSQTEDTLYSGLGWASRSRVLNRLEERSAQTSACREVAILRGDLAGAMQQIDRARALFSMASAQCDPVNRTRAQGNLDALDDTARDINVQEDYLRDLSTRCDTS